MNTDLFYQKSWIKFGYDATLFKWVTHALPFARKTILSPENRDWFRCGGTWFVGVNALPNDNTGIVGDSNRLQGAAIDFCKQHLGFTQVPLDQAQISICYPGYPQSSESESVEAYRYRVERDAAHVDGLLPEGPKRHRHLREHHSFILGIPMVEYSDDASPLVIWEGSHEIIRSAFRKHFCTLVPDQWGNADVTAIYQKSRREAFARCTRVEIAAKPGEAYVVHRLAVHGVAPWSTTASAGKDGRMICYFRPEIGGPEDWLNAP